MRKSLGHHSKSKADLFLYCLVATGCAVSHFEVTHFGTSLGGDTTSKMLMLMTLAVLHFFNYNKVNIIQEILIQAYFCSSPSKDTKII